MPKTRSFDNYHDEYEKWFIENKTIYENEIEVIKRFLPAFSLGLEIGVGTGRFAVPFGINTGVDPSFKMAVKAKSHGINVVLAAAESLPFKNNTFNFILIVTSICFFDNVQLALNEAYRVLKKSGCIIIGFIDADSTLGKEYSLKKERSKFYKEATFYSAETLTDYLMKAKFSNFEYKQALFDDAAAGIDFKKDYGEGGFVAIKANKAES